MIFLLRVRNSGVYLLIKKFFRYRKFAICTDRRGRKVYYECVRFFYEILVFCENERRVVVLVFVVFFSLIANKLFDDFSIVCIGKSMQVLSLLRYLFPRF